jgi:hypothetical protein
MTWQAMRIRGGGDSSLPGERGRYLLRLEAPMIEGEARYVHFSWKDNSFCIRDYIRQRERRQEPGLTPSGVWEAASDRIPCKGELYVPVDNFEFWTSRLSELTEKRRQGANLSVWSRLSTKFAPRLTKANAQPKNNQHEEGHSVYKSFVALWKGREGFDLVDGTVGCSARYYGEPLLWVYPTYFQIAPKGKRNAHFNKVMDLKGEHFPDSRGRGSLSFDSNNFSWDKFQLFVTAVQDMIQANS